MSIDLRNQVVFTAAALRRLADEIAGAGFTRHPSITRTGQVKALRSHADDLERAAFPIIVDGVSVADCPRAENCGMILPEALRRKTRETDSFGKLFLLKFTPDRIVDRVSQIGHAFDHS